MSEKPSLYTTIGLMSGTSMDGVDAALIRTDGKSHIEYLNSLTIPYDEDFKKDLRECLGQVNRNDPFVTLVERQLTEKHIEAVQAIRGDFEVDLIGFHGHTIHHDPAQKRSIQIGAPVVLGRETGIPVVYNMRQNDLKHGGQGAPLLPLYHQALAKDFDKPLAILNIGGVANITWLGQGKDDILAFDTGPGNAMIDDIMAAEFGKAYDDGGKIARKHCIRRDILDQWLNDSYFKALPPKSLDRDHWQDLCNFDGFNINAGDRVATLTQFTVESIAKALAHLPENLKTVYVCGGGANNDYIMRQLGTALKDADVERAESAGWRTNSMEAEGFGWLAVRSLQGLPLTHPKTTGVQTAISGGEVYHPQNFKRQPQAFANGLSL